MVTLRAHWMVWALILLGLYMAIAAPATLGGLVALIAHLLIAVAAGITQFLGDVVKAF
jgi:hypothetical protein